MKNLIYSSDFSKRRRQAAFTLSETVIAIGVLTVLLTGFIAVFTPALQGIRRSISSEQADRLATTLEIEISTRRSGQPPTTAATGFDKGFTWILEGSGTDFRKAIFIYQYRGNPAATRSDGTPTPMNTISGEPGRSYTVQSMVRRGDDPLLSADLGAIEGSIFFVKTTHLVFNAGQMTQGNLGEIRNPVPLPVRSPVFPTNPTNANDYSEAMIAFSAEFYSVPSKTFEYLTTANGFGKRYADIVKINSTVKPIFTRNLAVRR